MIVLEINKTFSGAAEALIIVSNRKGCENRWKD